MGAIQEIPRQNSIKGMGAVLATKLSQIKSVVASQVTAEKMARIALNELRLNDTLANAAMSKPDSFINAVMQASHLGLEIGGALGQCYLVPFKGEVKAMVGYRGLLTLARRSGFITSIKAEMVYENDTFELELGIDTKVTHKPLLTGDRGKPKLVYMVAHFTDGGHHFEWMSISDVDKIRGRSPSGKSGPWVTDYEQMALKTVIRRGWKFLPMSIEMQKTEIIEHAADTGKSLIIDGDSIEISPVQNDTEQETIADLAIDPQYMPKNSIDAIAAEMEKVTTESDLDKIQDTRVAPFTNKMRDEDIDRLNMSQFLAD
jgi:recombination protein RecT